MRFWKKEYTTAVSLMPSSVTYSPIDMMYWLSKLLFRLTGWQLDVNRTPEMEHCVLIALPHTSNWDLVFARAAFFMLRLPVRFTIKKEWMRFPLNLFIGPLGGIAIDRSPKEPGQRKKSMVDAMADLFGQRDKLVVMVTPEGTRSKATHWKTGFYHVAIKAKVPISLGYLDYANKIAGIGKVLHPSGDFERDIAEINAFYEKITPRHPDQFSIHLGTTGQ